MTIGETTSPSFFNEEGVQNQEIRLGTGVVPLGLMQVSNPRIGVGGAYGTWGKSYDNSDLPTFLEQRLGHAPEQADQLNLSELGFQRRHHIGPLSAEQHLELEVEVGARVVREAASACGWSPAEVDAILVGVTAPITEDYLDRVAAAAGMRADALKVIVHKACDSSVSSLHLALNPELPENRQLSPSIAERVLGKKVLVGGIEGLSRFMYSTLDANALQLFGNAAGAIGFIPGQAMKFLAGRSRESFDEDGFLQIKMHYPHSVEKPNPATNVEVTETGPTSIRVAGLMHEPSNGSSVSMAGPMGMVKLFVRTGVQVVTEAYEAYQSMMQKLGQTPRIAVAIVHHANYKINKLKEKQLAGLGIKFPMPWLLSEFGNVSAASNMIAFLRQLPKLKPGDHVLVDGFGAGTYYDVLAVEMGT
jgi:3-oxoacyl-[acyl-carrier-protein] synthase III